MVARSVCDCCPARAIMEKMDWFIDMVLFCLGAVTSSSASSPSLNRSGMSSDSLRGAFSESLRLLANLRLDLALPPSCDAIFCVGRVYVAVASRVGRSGACCGGAEQRGFDMQMVVWYELVVYKTRTAVGSFWMNPHILEEYIDGLLLVNADNEPPTHMTRHLAL